MAAAHLVASILLSFLLSVDTIFLFSPSENRTKAKAPHGRLRSLVLIYGKMNTKPIPMKVVA